MPEHKGNQHRNLCFPVKGLPKIGAQWTKIYSCSDTIENYLVDENVLYLCDNNHFIAINILNQKILWKTQIPEVWFKIPFSMNETSIVQGCYDGTVICLNKHTGTIRWKRKFEGYEARYSLIAIDSFALCVMHKMGKHPQLVCLHLNSGETFWLYHSPPPREFGNNYSHLMHDNGIVVYSAGSALYGLSLIKGSTVFVHDSKGYMRCHPVIDGNQVIYLKDKTLYFYSLNIFAPDGSYAFDTSFGYKGKWDEGIVVASDLVFCGSVPGGLHIYDKKTQRALEPKYFPSLISVADNHFYCMQIELFRYRLPDFHKDSYGVPKDCEGRSILSGIPPLLTNQGIFVYINGSIYRVS